MKEIIQNIKTNYKLVLVVLAAGLLLGWLFFHNGGESTEARSATESHEGHDHGAEEATVWTCSMHPQIKQNEPGDCPICGMDLIPLSSMQNDENGTNPNELMLTEAAAELANIRTTVVKLETPQNEIFLQGKVQEDERNISFITARYGGRIEKLFINFTGQEVKKGDKLATIYSPDLVTAQRELIEAAQFKESRPALYNAAKNKLRLWDISDEQVAEIEKNGEPKVYFDVVSPISGTVTMRHVALGDYVKEGSALFKVVDLSTVWIQFDAYESDLPWIKSGDKVEYTIPSLPAEKFSGKVAFIDPIIDAKTRIAKVRVEQRNPGQKIKPEMFVSGTVTSRIASNSEQLLVPKSAVLWTGKRAVVYVKVPERENPTFLYREITLGPEAGDNYVVAEGLEEGEVIATNGVFKIDAAAQLQGKPSMMSPEGGKVATGHDHGGTDMAIEAVEVDPAFVKQLTAFYEAYLKMNEAFIESDAAKVNTEAKNSVKALGNVEMELLKGDAHMAWMDQLKTLKPALQKIGNSNNIDEQRLEYATLNLALYKSLKMFGLDNDTTYYQYCPMANGDQGAYWFSAEKEIRNPYFGDMMLSCGETKETIK
ncbi:efflux RND transporter periplasmic adaptor subunit [Maribellus sediminis]|uniref:efflux RND transporter periplasmic adaptor subunit n=1 Tax=Maribellus sediminis TaxID=2696285 RepID=UPI001F10C766|nr:efflux RND transporter periplasmic adaptor subunit [Maribellus sediminis]